MKKFFAVLLAVLSLGLLAVGFAGCAGGGRYTVAVLQYAEHGSLDNCYEGIRAGLSERGYGEGVVNFVFYNAKSNDTNDSTYANTLIAWMPDVAVGIATPSAYALANAAKGKIPVVFTAVSDPEAEGADFRVFDNVTGSSDKLPVDSQIDLIKAFLNKGEETVKIGILYTIAEANSASNIAEFEALAEEKNVEIVSQGVNNANEMPTAIDTLISKGVQGGRRGHPRVRQRGRAGQEGLPRQLLARLRRARPADRPYDRGHPRGRERGRYPVPLSRRGLHRRL